MSRMSKAQETFPELDESVFNELAKLPGNGAYIMWGAEAVSDGHDVECVVSILKQFHAAKRRLPKEERDISRYYDLDEIGEALERLTSSKRMSKKADPGYTKILEYPMLTFYHVHAAHGMACLGRDTKWCITNPVSWERYKKHSEFIVVINHALMHRGTFSKIVIQIGNMASKENEFLGEEELKEFSHTSFRTQPSKGCAYIFFDANDSAYGFHNGFNKKHNTMPQRSMEELIDHLTGEKGAVKKAVTAVVGGSSPEEIDARMDRVHRIQSVLRRAQTGKSIPPLVEDVRELNLFNPLSLLMHPRMRAIRDYAAVWEACTDEEKRVHCEDYVQILVRPAVNIPGLLEFIFEEMPGYYNDDRWYNFDTDNLFMAAWRNNRLNSASRVVLSKMFLKHVISLKDKEMTKLFKSLKEDA